MIKDYGRIGVLMGGPSAEREISLSSGNAVLSAFRSLALEAVGIDIQRADKIFTVEKTSNCPLYSSHKFLQLESFYLFLP